MGKKIYFNESVDKLINGVNLLADAVKSTLGPEGKNVIIEKPYKLPHITKDGVSVAKEVESDDDVENQAIKLVRSVSMKTAEEAGDGTTTSAVLTQALVTEAFNVIKENRINQSKLRSYIQKYSDIVVDEIKKEAKVVETKEQLKQIATISANNDEVIGSLVSDAVWAVGKYGIVSIEESINHLTYSEVIEGIQYDQGFVNPYFAQDGIWKASEALILIYNGRIQTMKQLEFHLRYAIEKQKPILIVCTEVSAEVEATLIKNKMKGVVDVCVTFNPGFGVHKASKLTDIAIVCNATVIRGDIGEEIPNDASILGHASSVTVLDDSTVITANADKDKLAAHIKDIEVLAENAETVMERQFFNERISALSCGVAVIKVGGYSQAEVLEKKDRIEDAVCAAKSALQEGIVRGGGVTLLQIAGKLEPKKEMTIEESLAIQIIVYTLQSPIYTILENANADYWIENIHLVGTGYDIYTDQLIDMFDRGIVDPAKVTRCSIQNATSVALMILSTGCTITGKFNEEIL